MSILIVLIPPRPRLLARGAGAEAAAPASGEYDFVLSADGRQPSAQGRAAPHQLPRAASLVALLADTDVAWQRVTLPRAPTARLRQALHGVLEETLLDDDEAVHLALPPRPTAGAPTWIAVVHRSWLAQHLARLEGSGRSVDRVLPAGAPGEPARGHFLAGTGSDGATLALQLAFADADGAAVLPLAGTLARSRCLAKRADPVQWTASPAAAADAEAWLGAPVRVLTDAERAVQAAQGEPAGWNLRQFDLTPRHRGSRAVREGWRLLRGPAWRPVRLGALALVALHLFGLNAWALQQRQALDARRQAMVALLRSAHPQVSAVLDAPLQMARETERLRAAAGRPGEADLESLLGAAASAWPPGAEPMQGLRFESGQLTLLTSDWDAARTEAFRRQLQPRGWQVDGADGQLTLARAPAARP